MSCRISSKFGWSSRWATFDFWLVKKLSRQMTSWPSATSRSQRCEPKKAGAAGDENAFGESFHGVAAKVARLSAAVAEMFTPCMAVLYLKCCSHRSLACGVLFHGSEARATYDVTSRSVAEPIVRQADAFAEVDFVFPAQVVQAADIQQLAGRAVRFGSVEYELRLRVYGVTNRLGQFADRQIDAGAHVDRTGLVVVLQQKQAGIGQIVNVQELTLGAAGAPNRDFGAPCSRAS